MKKGFHNRNNLKMYQPKIKYAYSCKIQTQNFNPAIPKPVVVSLSKEAKKKLPSLIPEEELGSNKDEIMKKPYSRPRTAYRLGEARRFKKGTYNLWEGLNKIK